MAKIAEDQEFWRHWEQTVADNNAHDVEHAVRVLRDMACGDVLVHNVGMCGNFDAHCLDDNLLGMCYDSLDLRLGYPIEALASDFVACGVALPDDVVPGDYGFNIAAYDMLPKWTGPYGERRRALAGKCAGLLQDWLDAGVF